MENHKLNHFLTLEVALIASIGMLAVAPSVQAEPRSVDARQLDIAGVKTGMDFEQALAVVADHFHVSRNQIKVDAYPGRNIVTQTKLPGFFTYEKDGAKLTVLFEGRVPPDKARPLVVWAIEYEAPWSQENSDNMAKAAIAKYGPASNAPNTLPMEWCALPNANPGLGCNDETQSMLKLSQVSLSLSDPAWLNARTKFVEDARKVKPAF